MIIILLINPNDNGKLHISPRDVANNALDFLKKKNKK